MTNDITNIPLGKLTVWTGNVRKVNNKQGIVELAASIKAHGLQQNLVVRKDGRKFAVIAGGRRLKALQLLAKAGDIEASFEVPCRITTGDNATELSLAENVMREDMHPADQFEAFRDLTDSGIPVTDIAARFGCTEIHVQKLLKLARVSPKVIAAYRKEGLTLEEVMAFTVTDDHDAQEKVLSGFNPDRNDARDIREVLTEQDIAATDKRVKFITLKAYEKAGGTLKRDLFSEDDSGIYIENAELLDKLVSEKLETKAKPLNAEGWKWLLVTPEFGYKESSDYKRIYPEPVPLTADEQKQLDALIAEHADLEDVWYASDEDDRPERLEELDRLISEIEDRDVVWTPEQLEIAGAVVTIDREGKARIERGYVKPEDMPKISKKKTANAGIGTDGDTENQPANLSATLVESLTAHKSAALAASLLDAPEKGLAIVVYALVLETFGHHEDTVLQLTGKLQPLESVEGSAAFDKLQQARETWGHRIPGNAGDIWNWCLAQDETVLIDLLSFCAARMVNAVQRKFDRADGNRLVHADKLVNAVNLDMAVWFTPTAESYFGRIGKQRILDELAEARKAENAPAWAKLKKAELAKLAERETAGTGWLPEILRS